MNTAAKTNDDEGKGSVTEFLSKEDRVALAWIWHSYTKKYIFRIFIVFALVLTYSASMVAFIALLNNSISSLFDPPIERYEFTSPQLANGVANTAQNFDIVLSVPADDAGNLLQSPVLEAEIRSDILRVTGLDGKVILDAERGVSREVLREFISAPESSYIEFSRFSDGGVEEITASAVDAFVFLFAMLISATLVRVISLYASSRLASWVTAMASFELRRDLIKNIFRLDLAYFNKTPTGTVLLTLNELVSRMQVFFSDQLINAVRAATTIIGVCAYLLYIHAGLFLLVAVVFPLVYITFRNISGRMRAYMSAGLTAIADFLKGIENTVVGMQTIKLANQSDRATDELVNHAHGIAKIQINIARYTALIVPVIDFLTAVTVVLVVAVGSYAVSANVAGLTSSTLTTFILGLALLFSPANRLSGFNAAMITALVALVRMKNVFDQKPSIVSRPDCLTVVPENPGVRFNDIKFAFAGTKGSQPGIYQDLSLDFEPNKIHAVVGPTGSGKTTLIYLMTRLYDVDGGSVSLGGIDIRDIDLEVLRAQFSVVSQDTFVFDGSLEENVRYVAPSATDEEVAEALANAQLAILAKEKAGQSVGARGSKLSGGQRQRIGIARAFLRNAPILVLDEPTSALDSKTEALITSAFEKLAQGRTTIMIAHRLKTIENADKIWVMENGKLAEHGTHKSLMRQGALYSSMYLTQNQN